MGLSSYCADSSVDEDDRELNLSKPTVQTANVLKPQSPPFIHPFTVTVNLNFRQSSPSSAGKREENGGGMKRGISCSEHSLWPPDPTPDFTALAPSHFLNPSKVLSFQKLQVYFFYFDISQNEKMRWKKLTFTDHHAFYGCLIFLFYTLHSSPDGLSIDFDLACLCSALRACRVWVGVGWRSQALTLTTVTSSTWLRRFLCSNLPALAQSAKLFQIISTAVGDRQSKCWQEGKKHIWGSARDKITCSSRYVLQRVLWVGPNSPCCSPKTMSSKVWIISWHLNFVQFSFTPLCAEQMLQLESLKVLHYLNPFQVCEMRNTCSKINPSIARKPDLFKFLSPMCSEECFTSSVFVSEIGGKGPSHLWPAIGCWPIHGRIRIWPFLSHFVTQWKSYLIHLLTPIVNKVFWQSSSWELAVSFFPIVNMSVTF